MPIVDRVLSQPYIESIMEIHKNKEADCYNVASGSNHRNAAGVHRSIEAGTEPVQSSYSKAQKCVRLCSETFGLKMFDWQQRETIENTDGIRNAGFKTGAVTTSG